MILHPAHSYRRAPPAIAGCWCPDPEPAGLFLQHRARNGTRTARRNTWCPSPSATVVGGQFLLGPDRQWFAPSITDYPPAEAVRPGLVQRIAAGDVRGLPPAKPTVMIAKAGATNYGHTLTEILPRIINLARSALRDVRLLLPDGMGGVRADLLHACSACWASPRSCCSCRTTDRRWSRTWSISARSRSTTRANPRPCCLPRPAVAQPRRHAAAAAALLHRAPGAGATQPRQCGRSPRRAGSRRLRDGAPGHDAVRRPGAPVQPGQPHRRPAGRRHDQHAVRAAGLPGDDDRPGLADYFFWDLAALAGQPFTWMFTGPISFYSQRLESASYQVDLDGLRYALRLSH